MSTLTTARLADLVERAAWTAGQAFAAVLLTSPSRNGLDVPWELALSMAAGAAIVSALATIAQYLTGLNPRGLWPDIGTRLAKTFVAALIGAIGAGAFDVMTFAWSRALDVAFVATLAALGKCTLAAQADASPTTLRPLTYRATEPSGGAA